MPAEELQEMEAETMRLKNETAALKTEEKELRLAVREGASQMPLPDLKASVTALEQQKAEMEARLHKLKSGKLKPISIEERVKVEKEHRMWQRTAGARKKVRLDMWKQIEEMIEKETIEETKEGLGLEF